MALVVDDAASLVLNWLKVHADAAAIRALIYNGATNILEAGDLTAQMLRTDMDARRTASETSKVLFLTVWDAGERPIGDWTFEQTVVIRIIDAGRGYRNIRAVRALFFDALDDDGGWTLTDVGSTGQGVLDLRYTGRSGYRQSREYDAGFEPLTFVARIQHEEA